MYVLLTSENCTFLTLKSWNSRAQFTVHSQLPTPNPPFKKGRGGGKLKGGGFYALFIDIEKVEIRHHGNFKIPVHLSKLKRQYFTDFNFIFSAFTKISNTLPYHAKTPLTPSSVVTLDDVN